MNKLLRKILLTGIVVTLLSSIGLAFFKANMFAHAAGSISIMPDGSINPPTSLIVGDGTRYHFTDDISGEIVVQRSNIIIDGADHKLMGSGSGFGFSLTARSNVTIWRTEITNFISGIFLDHSSNCRITSNIIQNNSAGISLYGSSTTNNTVVVNLIANNDVGVEIDMSSESNLFYSNTFFENGIHARIWGGAPNFWSVSPGWGNYWDNYTGVDLAPGPNGNGVGDTPHILETNNIDQYPCMGRVYEYAHEVLIGNTWTILCISIVSNSSSVSDPEIQFTSEIIGFSEVEFNVTGPDGTGGFCRVELPHQLMEPPYDVTVNDNPVAYSTVYENETLSIVYFTYTHSTDEVKIVPDFVNWLFLPFLVSATLVGFALRKKLEKYTMPV